MFTRTVSGLDDVLLRLDDPDFRRKVVADPTAELASYDLTASEIARLAARLTEDADDTPTDARMLRAKLFALLASSASYRRDDSR